VRLREHRHNLENGLLEESKLAQHAYEEGHRVGLDEVRILETESYSRYRKYKELAHMAYLTNPISQASLDISPVWIPLISNEVTGSQIRSVYERFFMGFYTVLVGRAIAEAVSRWLPTAAARVNPGSGQVGFVVDKVAPEQVLSEYFGFPCHSFHQILHPHNHPGQVQ
jgi:hypothetical protein